jgi:Spy/CpxP family protein refolding chaperone
MKHVRKGLKMNSKKMQFVVVLALVFLMGASFAAYNAFAFGDGEGRHGRFGHDPLFMLFHKLNLTDPQKQQVAGILTQNEDQAKAIATGMANARAQLVKAILSGTDASAASQELATYSLKAAVLASGIVAQISPILTADQQAILQNMQAKIGSHVTDAINRRFAHWDKWIAKHSGQ